MEPKTTVSNDMSDTDLGQVLATFVKSQEKRDTLLREELTKVSAVASEASQRSAESITRIEGVDGKLETAFELLNKIAAASRTNWPTMFAGAVVIGGVMTSILLPIRSDITSNRLSIDANHTETRALVKSLNDEATTLKINEDVMYERQNQLAERIDWNRRMSNTWSDPNGNTAFPASEYIPFERLR